MCLAVSAAYESEYFPLYAFKRAINIARSGCEVHKKLKASERFEAAKADYLLKCSSARKMIKRVNRL